MFDFVFDNGIFFIVAAVFIGRLVLQLRRKGGEEKKKPSSPFPGFFREEAEEDDYKAEEEKRSYAQTRGSSDYLRELVLREAAVERAPKPPPPRPVISPAPSYAIPASAHPPEEATRPLRGKAGAFPASLNRLPPLKQAVILAEILGPPKGY
jgi:hypothetical protein